MYSKYNLNLIRSFMIPNSISLMDEYVLLVNEHDHIVGQEEKLKAHQQGLLHRAFSIFVLRQTSRLEILMQQRSSQKYHSGGLWTNTCCGHPRAGETVIEAGQRRLFEEIGLTLSLQEIGVFTYRALLGNSLVEHEIDHVLVGDWKNQLIRLDPDEVANVKWMSIEEITTLITDTPLECTAWVKEALEIITKKYHS